MMIDSMSALLSMLLAGSLLKSTGAETGIISVHGSGTSNPNRCFGSVMEEIQARAKLPVRLSYRSVGSSIGLEEFINEGNLEKSAFDFASTEIPVSTEDWQNFRDNNVTLLQIPTLFGAVTFFHSVPDMPNLNLTSCLLARIFTREIKDWAHPDIRELNPGLNKLFDEGNENSLGASLRIRVAVRDEGSSNTNAITQVSVERESLFMFAGIDVSRLITNNYLSAH
jgi:ABC-type phosphate transport system substrate-binding protein